jgi:hypothetical protein
MNSLTFFQNINSDIISILNGVLSVELAIACLWGVRHGFWLGKATVGKITQLATITAMLFGAWQWCPHQLVR